MLTDEGTQEELAQRGWARLPSLDAASVSSLRSVVDDARLALGKHGHSNHPGLDELWADRDAARRREIQRRIGAILAPSFAAWLSDSRAVLFNVWLKRPRSPRSSVSFHQDPAAVDERAGEVALQVWIPLVDVDAKSGALVVIERSHLDATPIRPFGYTHPLALQPVDDRARGAVQPTLREGDAIVFTNRTLHGSTANVGDVERPAIGAMLAPRGVPLVQWRLVSPERAELWAVDDDGFFDLAASQLPAGARKIDTVQR